MAAKYQVFVSSTYRDLLDERELVIKAVLEMGHIPVGMEMFSAADEEQWNIIRKQIDQSDYYIVILAHRYGSCDPFGLSYTEKEYDYAVSKGVPTLGFMVADDLSWPREKSDCEQAIIAKLQAFKEKVKGKPVSFWRNGDDLYGRCSIALMKAFNAYPREGWVRASEVQDAAASRELVRLSAENADLRGRLDEFLRAADEDAALAKVLELLRTNKRKLVVRKRGDTTWEPLRDATLYEFFETLAPELQVEMDVPAIASFVATMMGKVPPGEISPAWPVPRNYLNSILADLAAVDCISPSKRKKPVSDLNQYWCLTDFGIKLLAHMRRRRLERQEKPVTIDGPNKDVTKDI